MRPHPPLHCPLLSQIPHILGTLNFVGVSNVSLICLDLLPRIQEMTQNFVEYFNIGVLTCGVGTLDPHQVPPQDTHAQLAAEGGLPGILAGRKCVPFCHHPLLGDTEVSPINCHKTVIEDIPPFFIIEEDLWVAVGGGG